VLGGKSGGGSRGYVRYFQSGRHPQGGAVFDQLLVRAAVHQIGCDAVQEGLARQTGPTRTVRRSQSRLSTRISSPVGCSPRNQKPLREYKPLRRCDWTGDSSNMCTSPSGRTCIRVAERSSQPGLCHTAWFNRTRPKDVISGGPICYRAPSAKRYVLWSVGWKQRDDGGVTKRHQEALPSGRKEIGCWSCQLQSAERSNIDQRGRWFVREDGSPSRSILLFRVLRGQ